MAARIDLQALAEEVPDVNNPSRINYWKTVDDKQVYLEGWCNRCFAGTGIGEYETQEKINYAMDMTPSILAAKAREKGLKLVEGEFVETPDKDFLVGVTIGVYSASDPVGYRVGEPLETNALKVLNFEIIEMGNTHLIADVAKALNVQPSWDAIRKALIDRFGEDAKAIWLVDTAEQAERRYGPQGAFPIEGEVYPVNIPSDAIIGSDLGEDGKLWIWSKTPEDPLVEVRFLKDIPASTGLTGQRVGPYEKGHIYALQKETANFHVRMGDAEYMRAEAARPSLHDLFSGSTLDVYLEAQKSRPLVAAEMETQAIRRWTIRAKATDLGKQIQGEREKHGL
jgi:hypothetical protein